jgi:hypothetical protein
MIICIISLSAENPSQHGFHKFSSTATNLVTYLNSIIPSVSTQGQTDSVH